MSIFVELSLLLGLTTVVTLVVRLLKQPLVVGYILSGIVAGPYILNILHSTEELELFSKVGIVFLLFIVGLHLNPRVIKEVGSVSLMMGVGQVIFTSAIGYGLMILLGFNQLAAIYVSVALTFSSTIIILKLLADKNDMQKLYAKLTIGLLLVQDIIASFILIGITVFSTETSGDMSIKLLMIMLKGLGLLIGLFWVSGVVLPRITKVVAQSQELLFLFSLAWGTGLAALFMIMGFSIEIGALMAGVTLSVTPYADEVASRLKPLRDFFVIVFFILLGSQMVLSNIADILLPAFVLSLFVLVGNPVIVILIMNMLGYSRRTGFLAGMAIAQISEFSLILASLGMRVGHLSQETVSLITLVGLITIAGSTYLILYADKLYPRMLGFLKALELVKKRRSEKGSVAEDYTAVLFGYDRVGHIFAKALQDIELQFLVVDYNPQSTERLSTDDLPHRYGDAGDVEFLTELPVSKPKLIISTIPEVATNKLIINHMKQKNPRALLFPIAQNSQEAHELYEAGATYVIIPHYLGAEHAASLIRKHGLEQDHYAMIKEKHLVQLLKKYSLSV